jgi:GTPase
VVILVDREMHKPIILGAGGERMKRIATEARQDMERLFDAKVHLTCWIKIKSGWMDSTAMLRRLGLE